jgi:hypothetical protein
MKKPEIISKAATLQGVIHSEDQFCLVFKFRDAFNIAAFRQWLVSNRQKFTSGTLFVSVQIELPSNVHIK